MNFGTLSLISYECWLNELREILCAIVIVAVLGVLEPNIHLAKKDVNIQNDKSTAYRHH